MVLNFETTGYSGYTPSRKPKLQRNWGRIFSSIFWLGLLLSGGYFLLFSSYFTIRDIIVEGANKISPEEIKSEVQKMVDKKSNLFLFDKGKAEKDLSQKIPGLSKVEIYRGVPNALKVKISEREEKIIWKTGDDLYLIDSEGVAFEKASQEISLPTVEDKKNNKVEKNQVVVSSEFVNFVVELVKNFESKTQLKIVSLYVPESTFEIHLLSSAGFTLYLDTTGDAAYQVDSLVKVLPQISDKTIEYVDLRTPNWLYYK